MDFVFEQISTGGDRNFGYVLGDRSSNVAALVDPSYQPDLLVDRAEAQGLKVAYVINTHGHGDHTNGNDAVQQRTGAQVAAFGKGDVHLSDGLEMAIGHFSWHVLHVPGHCDDHIVLYEPTYHIAITGDHLFVGKIGGTGTDEAAKQQYDSLHRVLDELPPETTIWPGHDVGCRPSSTLGLEASTNPFLLVEDFDAFLGMKQSWSTFKSLHGLV